MNFKSNVQIIIATAILRRQDGGKLVTFLFLAAAGPTGDGWC